MAALAWASASQTSARSAAEAPLAKRLQSAAGLPSSLSLSATGGSSSSETSWKRRPTRAPCRSVSQLSVAAATWLGVCASSHRLRSRRRLCTMRASADILEKRVLKEPTHPDEVPRDGDLVRIHYVGKLEDGTIFDSSRWRREAFEFHLGEDDVIDAWHILIATMAFGERAELVCPPSYAYGEEGYPEIIPPNETLTFDVELMEIGRPIDKPGQEDEDDEDEETELMWAKEEVRGAGSEQGYSWKETGTSNEIEVRILLPDGVKPQKDLDVKIGLSSCRCIIQGKTVLDGKLFAEVQMDDSGWDLEKKDGREYVVITLVKLKRDLKWTSLLVEVAEVAQAQAVEVDVVDVDAALRAANAAAGNKSGGEATTIVDI